MLESARVLDLIVEGGGGRVCGARASVAGKPVEIVADATVLAAGGCGQVFRYAVAAGRAECAAQPRTAAISATMSRRERSVMVKNPQPLRYRTVE